MNVSDLALQLDIVLGQLRDDSENPQLQGLQEELKSLINFLNENIAELKPKQTSKPAPKQPSPPPEPEKWSRENHPAFKKAAPPVEEKDDGPVNYQVNDNVLAKWVSGDKGFYPGRITSITGSSTAPFYIVKFKKFGNTETLRLRDIKPISNKRKADGPPTPATPPIGGASIPPPPSAPGLVTSAGATRYPEAEEARLQDEAEKPPKPKKIKAKKELEAGKSRWQDFNNKSKFGKTQKKDSMFRTPDGVHGRGEIRRIST